MRHPISERPRWFVFLVLFCSVLLLIVSNSSPVSAAVTGAGRRYGGNKAGKGGGKGGRYYHQRRQQQQQERDVERDGDPQEDSAETDQPAQAGEFTNEQQVDDHDVKQESKPQEVKEEERHCMVSSGFLAPVRSGPLGLRVKRDADLPVERGLFVVIAIEPNSPGVSTLHVGDTIISVNGKPTKDMTVALFSQAINEARTAGTGLISFTFYTKHCPPPIVETPPKRDQPTQKENQENQATLESSDEAENAPSDEAQTQDEIPVSKPTDTDLRDTQTPEQRLESTGQSKEKHEDTQNEGGANAERIEEEEEEEDDEGDDEDDEHEEHKTSGRNYPGPLYGEYKVTMDNFHPPLGLRVSQEGSHLEVLGIMSKPEIWSMVRVGDILHSIQGEEPRSTTQLKEIVAMQQGKKRVQVRFLRKLPRKGATKPAQQSESGPRIQFTINHDRSKPLGLRLVSLPQTGNMNDGFLGVVEIKETPLDEYVQVGDRLRLVGTSLVTNTLEVSEALKRRQSEGGDSVALMFVRGVPGTLNDLGKGDADTLPRKRFEEPQEDDYDEETEKKDVTYSHDDLATPLASKSPQEPPKSEPSVETDDEDHRDVPHGDRKQPGKVREAEDGDEYVDAEEEQENINQTHEEEKDQRKPAAVDGASDDSSEDDEDEEVAELEKLRAEALARIREADELKLRADAKMKELERRREEQERDRQRRAQEEEQRKRRERELQEKHELLERELKELEQAQQKETCMETSPQTLDVEELEEQIFKALSDPETARAVAKQLVRGIVARRKHSKPKFGSN